MSRWQVPIYPCAGNCSISGAAQRVPLGALDEQLQAASDPGHVFYIQPDDEFGMQRAGEAEEIHRLAYLKHFVFR